MIIYYAGSGSPKSYPEKVLKRPAVLLTYYDFWKRKTKTLPDRFVKHKEAKDRKNAKGRT